MAAAVTLALVGVPSTAHAWPSTAEATIRPAAWMVTSGSGCTANFVFYDATDVYLGYAAHCAETPADGPVESETCGGVSRPLGTLVDIQGATRPGRLAYSSYETMQRLRETDEGACFDNDFAMVRVDPADHGRVNPTVPFWGGPAGRREAPVAPGEKVVSFGRSDLRQGIEETSPREGVVVPGAQFDWSFVAYYATPGIFGDSGSAVMDAAGSAAGVLVAITTIPAGANRATDLHHALAYMRSHGGPDARLALGTEPFIGPLSGPGAVDAPEPLPESPPPAPPPAPAGPEPTPGSALAPVSAASPPAATARKRAAKRKRSCRRGKGKRAKTKRARRCRRAAAKRRRR